MEFSGEQEEYLLFAGQGSRLFNFQILVDTDWFLFGLIDS